MHRKIVLAARTIIASAAIVTRVDGQSITARTTFTLPRSSTRVENVTERMGGFLAGIAVDFDYRGLMVGAESRRGKLRPDADGRLRRDVGDLSLSTLYRLRRSFEVDAHYTRRVLSSPAGYQRWDLAGVGVVASKWLRGSAARVTAGIAYLPLVSATNASGGLGVATRLGMLIAPAASPLEFRIDYRIERYGQFANTSRADQFETFAISAGVRVQRHAGHWKLGS